MFSWRRFESTHGVFSVPHHTAHTNTTPHTPHKAQTGCSVFVGDFCCAFMLSTMVGVGNATGAAMRRRQRRLRGLAMNGCRSLWHWLQWSTIRTGPLRTPPQGARRQAPVPERERSASNTAANGHTSDLSRDAASTAVGDAAAGGVAAAHCGAEDRAHALRANPRRLLCRRRLHSWWISSRI